MTVRLPPSFSTSNTSEVWAIDFRETAPALSNRTMFVSNPTSSRLGGLSVGVPGEIRGLAEAHSRWGALSWKEVVQPAADLAREFEVGKQLAKMIRLPVSC